jgi:hypothetical protein
MTRFDRLQRGFAAAQLGQRAAIPTHKLDRFDHIVGAGKDHCGTVGPSACTGKSLLVANGGLISK